MDKKKIGIGIAVLLVVGLIIAAVCIFANGGDTDKTPNETESSTTTTVMTGGSTTVQNETEPSSDAPSQSTNGPVEDSIFDNDTTTGNSTTNASVADTTVNPVNGTTASATTLGGSTDGTDTTKTTGKVTASTARTTKPIISTTKPIISTTKPIISTTKPIIGTTKPTTASTKPTTVTTTTTTTKPTTTTTAPATDPDPITYEQYHAMSAKDQRLYMESFTSIDAFFEWYNAARDKYEQDNPAIDVGDGSFDLGDLL